MPIIANMDYPNKRIYLSSDTVGIDLDPIDVYKEARALRASTPDHRKFLPMIRGEGNESLGARNKDIFTILEQDVRIVAFDGSHTLNVVNALVSIAEGLEGTTLFDFSPLSPSAQVNVTYEVRVAGVNARQAAMIEWLWKRFGGDPLNPTTFTPTSIKTPDDVVDITLSGDNTSTTTATQS